MLLKQFHRFQRISQELQKKIAIIIQFKIKDPRLKIMITISSVEVSKDLSYAKIFITIIDDKNLEIRKNILKILKEASGYIRIQLSKTMRLRIVPKIFFFYDKSLTEGLRITNLVNKAIKK